MKTKLTVSIFFLFVITTSVVFAQNNVIKIGYANTEYILTLLPKYKEAESQLKAYESQLRTQLESKYKEYQTKLEIYQKDMATMQDLVKQDKEKELISLTNSIKEFEENATGALQKKQTALLDPLVQSVQKAIEQVAEENGYTYILNNEGIILYAKNKNENISELVLKKLGVTLPANTDNTMGTNNPTTTPANTGTGTKTTTTTAPIKKK